MGWKGVLREVERAAKAAQKEEDRREKAERKRRQREAAEAKVRQYQARLDRITSVHCEVSESRDWEEVANREPPDEPGREHSHEEKARAEFENYQPSLLDRVLGREDQKREKLREAISEAEALDQEKYTRAKERYERELAAWKRERNLAGKLLNGETEAYYKVVQEHDPFESIDPIDGLQTFEVHSSDLVSLEIAVKSEEVIPSERKKQLKSGKLSVTDMPKTKRYAYHQDYVCGCVLRAAREIHGLLPVKMTVVTATSEMLNPATGHIEEQPIVSVAVPKETLERLAVERVSPSEAMTNFVHESGFRKTKGFKATSKVDPQQFMDEP